jgi:hypothetical protein
MREHLVYHGILGVVVTLLAAVGFRAWVVQAGLPAAPHTTTYTALAAGNRHTCGLTSTGGVRCWGWNDGRQLGDGTRESRFAPVDAAGLYGGVLAIAANEQHSCALLNSRHAQCWGDGQLAVVDVGGLSGATDIATNNSSTCARLNSGSVKCWSGYASPTPVLVSGLNDAAEITAGEN